MHSDSTALLTRASTLAAARDWPAARHAAALAVAALPTHPHARFLCGASLIEMQQAHDAIPYLAEAARLDPHSALYAIYHARALANAMRLSDAITETGRARTLAPDDALIQDTAGVLLDQCGLHDPALEAFRQAVSLAPDNPDFRFSLATALANHGHTAEAEQAFEACIQRAPRHWRAHHSLSQLRTQTRESNHLPRLRALLPLAEGRTTASAYLHMALAKEHEDLGDYPAAFQHMQTAKAGPRRLIRYDARRDARLFEAIAGLFPEPVEADGHPTGEPIFILGMPRSGTTLVERILSSHPQVQAAGELHAFPAALKRAAGNARLLDPDDVARIQTDRIDWNRLGQEYLDSTRPLSGGRPRFTDKLPHNFLHAGFIARALPNARLVLLRRDPMDTCLSNFRLLFAPESPYFDYSYDLLDVGRYYLAFNQLMAHWKRVLPGRILEIHYESIVADQEASTRQLLEFCNLPWDPACLQFHANRTAVATASAAQVRKPLYRSAVRRWERYGEQLAPLQELLTRGGIAVD